jgi:deoxyribodipyrimidine photolyase-related protein
MPTRNLILVLGDQLDRRAPAFDGLHRRLDAVWMAEATAEATHVWSHQARIAYFLSAMRHFRDELRAEGLRVHYHALGRGKQPSTLAGRLQQIARRLSPARLVVTHPGEWRVLELLRRAARELEVPLEVREDRHFLCSLEAFREHAGGRKQLRMEHFYRAMRRRHGVLMEGDRPSGGRWNYDADNRQAFGRQGPGEVPPPPATPPDVITREVLELVQRRFGDHPGSLASFAWPVTRARALEALGDFVEHRLPRFGRYQDAMWTGEPFLYHSLLSCAMNVKLLDPREVIEAAEQAQREDPRRYPLAAVEGFIRQILGWREYVRGIYWLHMPGYLERNALDVHRDLPAFYWTAETEMRCLRLTLEQTLAHAYAHHIQRLMVSGLLALLLGVAPRQVHAWYLSVYLDAVEWVELPNTLGMSQFADGGLMASKPYAASGKYIQRMSNYCAGCRFDPARRLGPRACPFTTLYWDFLTRNRQRLAKNPRMSLQLNNLRRLSGGDLEAIGARARQLSEELP